MYQRRRGIAGYDYASRSDLARYGRRGIGAVAMPNGQMPVLLDSNSPIWTVGGPNDRAVQVSSLNIGDIVQPFAEAGANVASQYALSHIGGGSSGSSGSSSGGGAVTPYGGGSSRSGHPQWPVQWVANALGVMSSAQLASLQTSLDNSHVPGASVNDPASVQYWCSGGSDGNVGNAHPDVVAFNSLVARVNSGSANTSGGGAPSTSVQTGHSSNGGGGSSDDPWYVQLLHDIEHIGSVAVSAGANAATTAAASATYQSLSPAQQQAIARQNAPTLLGTIPDSVKIVGGIALGALLLKMLSK